MSQQKKQQKKEKLPYELIFSGQKTTSSYFSEENKKERQLRIKSNSEENGDIKNVPETEDTDKWANTSNYVNERNGEELIKNIADKGRSRKDKHEKDSGDVKEVVLPSGRTGKIKKIAAATPNMTQRINAHEIKISATTMKFIIVILLAAFVIIGFHFFLNWYFSSTGLNITPTEKAHLFKLRRKRHRLLRHKREKNKISWEDIVKADEYFMAGKYKDALLLYERIFPYIGKRDIIEQQEYFKKIIETCEKLKLYEKEVNYFRKALSIFPKEPNWYLRLGRLYIKLGKEDKAVEVLEKGKLFCPFELEISKCLAELYYRQNKKNLSLIEFQNLTPRNLSPGQIRIYSDLLIKDGKPENAKAVYLTGAEIYRIPDFFVKAAELAKQMSEKIEILNKALECKKNLNKEELTRINLTLAFYLTQQGHIDQAILYLKEVDSNKISAKEHFYFLKILIFLKDIKTLSEEGKKFVKKYYTNMKLNIALENELILQGYSGVAEKIYMYLLDIKPKVSFSNYYYARIQINPYRAKVYFQKALNFPPLLPEAYRDVGRIYFTMKKWRLAYKMFFKYYKGLQISRKYGFEKNFRDLLQSSGIFPLPDFINIFPQPSPSDTDFTGKNTHLNGNNTISTLLGREYEAKIWLSLTFIYAKEWKKGWYTLQKFLIEKKRICGPKLSFLLLPVAWQLPEPNYVYDCLASLKENKNFPADFYELLKIYTKLIFNNLNDKDFKKKDFTNNKTKRYIYALFCLANNKKNTVLKMAKKEPANPYINFLAMMIYWHDNNSAWKHISERLLKNEKLPRVMRTATAIICGNIEYQNTSVLISSFLPDQQSLLFCVLAIIHKKQKNPTKARIYFVKALRYHSMYNCITRYFLKKL